MGLGTCLSVLLGPECRSLLIAKSAGWIYNFYPKHRQIPQLVHPSIPTSPQLPSTIPSSHPLSNCIQSIMIPTGSSHGRNQLPTTQTTARLAAASVVPATTQATARLAAASIVPATTPTTGRLVAASVMPATTQTTGRLAAASAVPATTQPPARLAAASIVSATIPPSIRAKQRSTVHRARSAVEMRTVMKMRNRIVRICRRALNKRVRRDNHGPRELVPWVPSSLHPSDRVAIDPMQCMVPGESIPPPTAPDIVGAVLTHRSLASVQRDEPPDVLNLPHASKLGAVASAKKEEIIRQPNTLIR